MKKVILILILTLSFNAFSQGRGEKLRALKVAFITERLDLTQEEAQKFWPIYNAFEEEHRMLRINEHQKLKQINEDLTDEQATTILKDIMEFDEERVKLENDLYVDLLKAIPAKKILLLKKAEDDFKREMLEQFKKRRQGRP